MGNYGWLREIDATEYLSPKMKKICEAIGLEAFIKLCECCNGQPLYLPCDPFREAKRAYIVKRFNGSNVEDISKELGLTRRAVYKYVAENRQTMRNKQKRRK